MYNGRGVYLYKVKLDYHEPLRASLMKKDFVFGVLGVAGSSSLDCEKRFE